MSVPSTDDAAPRSATWLPEWNPEDEQFWNDRGRAFAKQTLIITTASLMVAFAVWFVVSAIIVRLEKAGFTLSKSELYWLAAMPGLAGGTFRLIHMFLTPIYGTRHVVSISTALLIIPLVGWWFAVQNPDTPYIVLLGLAFLAGLGGGNFSSFMPSTSLFYPKRDQGTALGVQAGIGNFGVSLVQFLTPWVIGFALVGSAVNAKGDLYLQNAVLIWMPLVILLAIVAWLRLRSIPVRADMHQQMDIFREKHTWTMTSLYIMTFGSFAGFAAAFPVLIKNEFGDFADAPDPLTYAFIGPLVGSAMRIIAGPISDKVGGAKVTQVAAVGLIVSTIFTAFYVAPDSRSDFTPFVLGMVGMFFFAGIGNASTFKQIPSLFPPLKAAGVIGWTAAIAAYGPFIVSVLISFSNAQTGDPAAFFFALVVFYLFNLALNWWFFARRNAPDPC
jgi:NNP family nitrate/nitrite transporter-like MFS transporter